MTTPVLRANLGIGLPDSVPTARSQHQGSDGVSGAGSGFGPGFLGVFFFSVSEPGSART